MLNSIYGSFYQGTSTIEDEQCLDFNNRFTGQSISEESSSNTRSTGNSDDFDEPLFIIDKGGKFDHLFNSLNLVCLHF